ncbi:hypothetical protein Tco_1025270 [Tanacetum coccineum]
MQDKKLDLSFFHVFGALYYPTNDNDDLGKLDAKANIGIFVGYAPAKKALIIYNKRTWKIIETIHETFDELTAMASEQFRYFLSPSSYCPAMSKNDMKDCICTFSKNDLKDLVKTYRIPLDLHPRFPDPEFTMDRLLADAIGIYFEFL